MVTYGEICLYLYCFHPNTWRLISGLVIPPNNAIKHLHHLYTEVLFCFLAFSWVISSPWSPARNMSPLFYFFRYIWPHLSSSVSPIPSLFHVFTPSLLPFLFYPLFPFPSLRSLPMATQASFHLFTLSIHSILFILPSLVAQVGKWLRERVSKLADETLVVWQLAG